MGLGAPAVLVDRVGLGTCSSPGVLVVLVVPEALEVLEAPNVGLLRRTAPATSRPPSLRRCAV